MRLPKNKAELAFCTEMLNKGWFLSRRGWPDYFCIKDGRPCLVEVKPKHGYRLKRDQAMIMRELAAYGVECYKWSPDGGFEKIEPPVRDL